MKYIMHDLKYYFIFIYISKINIFVYRMMTMRFQTTQISYYKTNPSMSLYIQHI